ncbi:DUF4294 domain-containing protein [Bacteroidota bacterium]
MRNIIMLAVFFISVAGICQENVKKVVDSFGKYYIIHGDSVPAVNIKEVSVFPPRVFNNKRQQRRYSRLTRNIKKVLPYAKIAAAELDKIDASLENISLKNERKKIIKESEKELFNKFEGELVNLTFTQGRLLIKLVDRETSNTTYNHVKELRGSFSAFFWQGVARIFGSNLKSEYDPEKDDILIEEIIKMIEAGVL